MPTELAQKTISLYWDFLTKGVNSKDFIVRRAAKALDREPVKEVSAGTYLAGVNHFLRTSQMKLKDMASLLRVLTKSDALTEISSLPQLEPRQRNKSEQENILSNTLKFGNAPLAALSSSALQTMAMASNLQIWNVFSNHFSQPRRLAKVLA